jgi:superfamily II DNA or RNA helicase
MSYGVRDLVRTFGLRSIKQARSSIEAGQVDTMPAGPGARRFFGVVRCPGRRAVRVMARDDAREHGTVELSGDCTCSQGRDCQHVAAVLLDALGPEVLENETWRRNVAPRGSKRRPLPTAVASRPAGSARAFRSTLHEVPSTPSTALRPAHRDDAEERAVGAWLIRLESAIEGGGEERADRTREKHRVLYLLDVQTHTGRFTVHPVRVYVRNDQRYGATRRVGFTGGANRPAYLTVEDRELLPAILGNSQYPWSVSSFFSPVAIDSLAAGRLLERLLATGRCHWRSKDTPALRPGEARAGRIEWSLDREGRQRPQLAVEGAPDAVALAVDPPWYVDGRGGVAGPLRLDVDFRAASVLLDAPALTPEAARRVHDRLKETAASGRLPLPVPISVEARELRSEPVPHLRLHMWRVMRTITGWAPIEPIPIPAATLTFDYEVTSVHADAPGDVLQQVVGDKLVRVHRDLEFEQRTVGRLESLGFTSMLAVAIEGTDEEEPAGRFLPGLDAMDIGAFLVEFACEVVPLLREAGWVVEMDDDYPFRTVEGDQQWYAEVTQSANAWFDLELGVEIDGERHSLLPILVDLLRHPDFDLGPEGAAAAPDGGRLAVRTADGRMLLLPGERVRAIVSTLTELYGDKALSGGRALPLSVWSAPLLTELDETLGEGRLAWSGGDRLRELGRKLRGFHGMKKTTAPRGFRGELRPYQREGLNWLQFLREHDLAGVLADDMGLGKTVQVLAHLLAEKRAGRMDRPSLVVAPTSVVTNWKREAERFAPGLRVLVLHGQSRKAQFGRLAEHDLVLTTYPLLSRDREQLRQQPYHALILDEAQFVKNAKTKAAKVARELEARHRLCLTGTPMENHLGELWSLFHILLPGLLGDARQFRKLFRTPIEKHGDRQRRDQLAARVRPFLLRRTKDQVATELPPKTEMTRTIELERAQRDLYESIRLAMNSKVRKAIARKGLERSTIAILDALLKLRQVCCDPRLLKIEEARKIDVSAKLDALMEMLGEMLEEGRRILLFSQFTSMIRLIEEELRKRGVTWAKITGNTRDRDTPVRRFQRGEVPLFLISLKAGGTGLNLTAADTVIHYDPWWNPAVEDQATDRAHRIGQDKPVFVYRLIVSGSVEEKMLALQARKRELVEGVYGGRGARRTAPFSAEDLEVLFQPLQ